MRLWMCGTMGERITGGNVVSGQSWTPAPKRGIVPLHPMTFGTVLGRSFAALRHNPAVLFGFAVVVQLVVLVASTVAISATVFATFSRLETVSPSSPDFEPLLAGAVAWNLVVAFLVGLASTAFIALVQGIVAADVGFAAVGEKASLGQLWRRVRPALWRLFAFAGLSILFGFVLLALIAALGIGIAAGIIGENPALTAFGVIGALVAGAAAIPLVIWLSTKLMLVPSALVLEGARFREALVRSWRLTRRRFWFAFGVMAVITVIMGAAAQVVSIPATLISTFLSVIITPTGSSGPEEVIAFLAATVLPQILVLVVQAVGVVVQCTGSVLVYIDCRMRYEGLDQTLLTHIERRDQATGSEPATDPFAVDPARAVTRTPPPAPVYAPPAGYAHPQGYAPPQGYGPPPGYGTPPAHGAPPYAPTAGTPAPPATPPAAAPAPPAPTPPGSETTWAAPGGETR